MPDMLVWTFGVHSVVLPISLIGLYRYSDRRERFAKAIGDTTELLARMRRRIATALEKELAQVFQRTEGRTTDRIAGRLHRTSNQSCA